MLTGDDWDNSVFSWNTSLYMFKFSTLTVGLAHIGYGEIRGSWHSFPLSRCRPGLYTAIKQYIDDPWVGFRNMPYSWYALKSEASPDIGAMMLGKCVCVCGGGGGEAQMFSYFTVQLLHYSYTVSFLWRNVNGYAWVVYFKSVCVQYHHGWVYRRGSMKNRRYSTAYTNDIWQIFGFFSRRSLQES